jgi:hypothetical protein
MKNLKKFEDFSVSENDNYPMGANYNPDAPWNREDPDVTRGYEIKSGDLKFDLIGSDYSEIAILNKRGTNEIYAMYFEPSDDEFREYMEVEREYVGRDEDGDPEYEYAWDNAEVDDDAILGYATDKANSEGTKDGLSGYEEGFISKIDPELAEDILGTVNYISNKYADKWRRTWSEKYKAEGLDNMIKALSELIGSSPE